MLFRGIPGSDECLQSFPPQRHVQFAASYSVSQRLASLHFWLDDHMAVRRARLWHCRVGKKRKKRKGGRNFKGRQTENEVGAPEGGVCRLMQFRDKRQKSRGWQQLSASARVEFDGWEIRYACLHCQTEAYRIFSAALCAASRPTCWKLKKKLKNCSRRLSFQTQNCEICLSLFTNKHQKLRDSAGGESVDRMRRW